MRYLLNKRYLIIFLAILCTSCGTALPTIKPYKLNVQQGNVVTSAMLLQLRPGMTKSQVRFIMGTPLIQDSFHGSRWDYVYEMRESGKVTEQRRVILDFENELLKTVRGDVISSGSNKSDTHPESDNIGTRIINPPVKPEEKGFFSRLKFWEKDEVDPAKASAAAKEKDDSEAAKTLPAQPQENKVPADKVNAAEPQKMEILPIIIPSVALVDVSGKVLPVDSSPIIQESEIQAYNLESTSVPVGQWQDPVVNEVAIEDLPVTFSVIHGNEGMLTEQPAVVAQVVVGQATDSEAVVESQVVVEAMKSIESLTTAEQKALEQPEEASKESLPKTLVTYDSQLGMKFDTTLRLASENIESETLSESMQPRAGNKSIPRAKDVPPDSGSSGFMGKMSDKIGF